LPFLDPIFFGTPFHPGMSVPLFFLSDFLLLSFSLLNPWEKMFLWTELHSCQIPPPFLRFLPIRAFLLADRVLTWVSRLSRLDLAPQTGFCRSGTSGHLIPLPFSPPPGGAPRTFSVVLPFGNGPWHLKSLLSPRSRSFSDKNGCFSRPPPVSFYACYCRKFSPLAFQDVLIFDERPWVSFLIERFFTISFPLPTHFPRS